MSCNDNSRNHAAVNQRPAPAFLKQVQKKQIQQGQGSPHHIRYGGGSSGPQIGSKLFCTHGYKNGPVPIGKTQHGTKEIHGGIAVVEIRKKTKT